MKKAIVILILAVLLLNLSCRPITILDKQHTIKTYEAENAKLLDGIIVRNDSNASGGKYIRINDSGSVLFKVNVKRAGPYELLIGYRAPDSDKAQRILVNDKEYAPEIGFSISAEWTEAFKISQLKAGINKIELRKSWPNMDIDYITVRGPVIIKPEISPARNTFYKVENAPDLYIKLDKNANRLVSITNNSNMVPHEAGDVWYTEDSAMIKIPADYLMSLDNGLNEILFNFKDIEPLKFELEMTDAEKNSDWTIVSLDVRHGTSVLMIMPTGGTLLIDTGTETMCKERVIPFLERHNITPEYLLITHYHDDHAGGKDLIEQKYEDIFFADYNDLTTGQQLDFEDTYVTILNSYKDGYDENTRSISFRMEYKGFVYTHGGDIYADNQKRILQEYSAGNYSFPLQTHIYHANHHFHGSVDADYLRAIDPYLFIVSGEEHIYGRAAYTHIVQRNVLRFFRAMSTRFIEDLLHFETGHVVIRVSDGDNWSYETYKDTDAIIPFLQN